MVPYRGERARAEGDHVPVAHREERLHRAAGGCKHRDLAFWSARSGKEVGMHSANSVRIWLGKARLGC